MPDPKNHDQRARGANICTYKLLHEEGVALVCKRGRRHAATDDLRTPLEPRWCHHHHRAETVLLLLLLQAGRQCTRRSQARKPPPINRWVKHVNPGVRQKTRKSRGGGRGEDARIYEKGGRKNKTSRRTVSPTATKNRRQVFVSTDR